MCRWLFQRLQHRVKRRLRQHMHFVDDIHLETSAGWHIQRAFQQFAHIIHLRIRGCIQLDQIDKAPTVNFGTGAALATGRGSDTSFTIQRFGKDTRDGGFAYAAGSGEQIGMVQAILHQRVAQRLHDMLLPRQLSEVPGTPLTR